MTIRRMRTTRWITKATDTHSEYVILTAFPQQLWMHEGASVLRYTCITCLVFLFKTCRRMRMGGIAPLILNASDVLR